MSQDTIQDQRAFEQEIYDIIEAYLEANDCIIYGTDGVYVDGQLHPEIINAADAEDSDRFYPLCSLIREDEDSIEADKELVSELAGEYFG